MSLCMIAGSIAFANIPPTNPTKPSAVTSLGITPRAGAIEFNWDDPTVWPVGAFFRVMAASVNSYGAAASIWEGDARRAVVTRPNTASLYHWLDSVSANGSYNTFPGVGSGMLGYALLTETAHIQPDAATKLYTATASYGNTDYTPLFGVSTIAESGIFEVSVVGAIDVTSFSLANTLTVALGADIGAGVVYLGRYYQDYRIEANSVSIPINFSVTMQSSGSGPWGIGMSAACGTAMAAFKTQATIRVAVIRR